MVAREIEFSSMPPKKKWKTALEGAIVHEEGALAALRDLSQRKGARNQQEAADTLAFVAKLPLKP